MASLVIYDWFLVNTEVCQLDLRDSKTVLIICGRWLRIVVESHPTNDRFDIFVHPDQIGAFPALQAFVDGFSFGIGSLAHFVS